MAVSIRQRLLDLNRATNGNFQDCLDRYEVERAETEGAISNEDAKVRLGKWLAA